MKYQDKVVYEQRARTCGFSDFETTMTELIKGLNLWAMMKVYDDDIYFGVSHFFFLLLLSCFYLTNIYIS